MISEFKKQLEIIPQNDWIKLFELIPEIESSNKFGSLAGGEEFTKGIVEMPFVVSTDIANKLVHVVYDIKLVLNFDWGKWTEGRAILQNNNLDYETLDTLTLCKLLTMIIRADRFSDGYLVSNFENGTVLKIMLALRNSKIKNKTSINSNGDMQIIKTHKFGPKLFSNTKKILVGTLPPESAMAYFSNSTNTRLWDLLQAILMNESVVAENTNSLSWDQKEEILKGLSLGITDIIYQYSRTDWESVKDNHIIPIVYNDIVRLIENTQVEQILFVYKNAARWFLHSLVHEEPKVITKLKDSIELGIFHKIIIGNRTVECVLIPSPLNRGLRGQTMPYKLDYYRKFIKS